MQGNSSLCSPPFW